MTHNNDFPLKFSVVSLSSDLRTRTKFATVHMFGKSTIVNMVPKRVEIELAHSFNRWNIVWSKGFAYVKLFQKLFDNKAVKA